MTRDLPPEEDEDKEPEQPRGHVRATSVGTVLGLGLTALVVGRLVRPVSIWRGWSIQPVGWFPVLGLILVAAILGGVAWLTHRDLHRRGRRLEPHKAVNRLVLAKSSALVGALVAGGYLGYALSWVRVSDAALARQRMVQSLIAGVAGVLIVAAALLLERACRVREGDDADLR